MKGVNHIVLVCSYLHVPGGYEKAVITTANLFSRNGWQVTLLILDQNQETYFEVDKEVNLVQDDLDFGISRNRSMSHVEGRVEDCWQIGQLSFVVRPVLLEGVLLAWQYGRRPIALKLVLGGDLVGWTRRHHSPPPIQPSVSWLVARTKFSAARC